MLKKETIELIDTLTEAYIELSPEVESCEVSWQLIDKTFKDGAEKALTDNKILKSANLYTQEEVNDLLEENKYLKAEFEINKDKVFTQEDMDKAKEESYWQGWSDYGESL